jgi:hypothetical protein
MASESPQAHARELLRYLDDPRRLRRNPIAMRCYDAGADLREYVHRAILQLPEPLRRIIVRCDLAKELHSVVAADLGISERHFYRQRRQALARLTEILLNAPVSARSCTVEAEPVGVQLSHAKAHENAGGFDAAIAILVNLKSSVRSPELGTTIACRLVEVCCSAGRLVEAQSYLKDAQGLATRASAANVRNSDVTVSQLETAKLEFAWCFGDLEYFRSVGEPLVRRLRRISQSSIGNQTALEMLISVLLMLADSRCFKGAFREALDVTLEAMALLNKLDFVDDALRLRCLNTFADLQTFMGGGLQPGLDELGKAYAQAQAKGIPRAAVNIAVNLCGVYTRSGDMGRALHFGYAALNVGKSVCPSEEFARNTLAVAAVHLFRRELRPARALLAQARALTPPENRYVSALATLFEADMNLIERNYTAALAAARTSAHTMEGLGMHRFLGSALRVEAEAQEALGNHAAAVRTITNSLSVLGSSGHPFVLARSYRSSALICREYKHQLAADDLTRALHT